MKLKSLLLALLISTGVFAQDTIRTLIFSEVRMNTPGNAYMELTNMGVEAVDLGDFKIGAFTAHTNFDGNLEIQLPQKMLQPGESFVIASVEEFAEKMYPTNPDLYRERTTKIEMWDLADMQINHPADNSIEGLDSITPIYEVMTVWGIRAGWYLEQHLSATDSVPVDQVGGMFTSDEGTNDGLETYDVAGVTDAVNNSILIRKLTIKKGNLDFANARGVGEGDSEWIVIPESTRYGYWRAAFWTIGNHGDYNLDENTLVSDVIDVDFVNKTMTVPWGVRKWDDIMNYMEKKPGIAWHYQCSSASADSNYVSARNGDKFTVYVCGEDVDADTFDIVVAEPTNDANIVIPKYRRAGDGHFPTSPEYDRGRQELYQVTQNNPEMDTITRSLFGLWYATRVDSLLAYLEKAPKASWEIVWGDDVKRPDLKNGDILKVTAENGAVKEYYIKVRDYEGSSNAELAAITWPDIPEYLKGIFGWKGDTIPGFNAQVFNYNLQVPADVDEIPALIAKPVALNTKVEVKRATSLDGNVNQRTISFMVASEDGEVTNTYNIVLSKQKSAENVQPFIAEPFLSELVSYDVWGNGFVEVCNPGTEILDLSNYMIAAYTGGSPADAITSNSTEEDWLNRYTKFVPGYKWVDEATWSVAPATLAQDLNVNSYVYPGDVFVAADVQQTWVWTDETDPRPECDVIFNTNFNPWNEEVNQALTAARPYFNGDFYLFKILNDSIKQGLKPANDPNDFELIDVFGNGEGQYWVVGGYSDDGATNVGKALTTYIRRPQYVYGNPVYNASFGTNIDNTEWYVYTSDYWTAKGFGWPYNVTNATLDVGKHFFNEVTTYKSTLSSAFYKISPGYQLESIAGIVTGTTVAELLEKLVKAQEDQTLTFVSGSDGAELELDAVLNSSDTLIVVSADESNITKYVLDVADVGLSSDAKLISDKYDIIIEVEPKSAGNEDAGTGKIQGVEYGTALNSVLARITVPDGASLTIIDGDGAYLPLKRLNYDTAYVYITATSDTYLDVVAEDGITEIVYQIIPQTSEDDAFITSDVYAVDQKDLLVKFVPGGTSVGSLIDNLIPSLGASVKIVNKMGQERIDGGFAVDDKIVVTSPNGLNTKTYFISTLATEYNPVTTYLAYILSDVYAIDQVQNVVAGVIETTVSEFYANITTPLGAAAVVVDASGIERTSGAIQGGDMVKVTSADGKIEVMYELTTVGIRDANVAVFKLYPNPTNGHINISGVRDGYSIRVYNSLGVVVRERIVRNNIETISLQKQPSGMYMIVISDKDKLLGTYKALKK